jgi:colanic acid biosynthesis glycosyl transferase WcaI
MKVLLLNQYFPPDTSATAALAEGAVRALQEAGDEVTVIAGRPSYEPRERLGWRPLRVGGERWGRVVRVGSTAFERARMAGRVGNYLSYLALAAPIAAVAQADVTLAMTDPPIVSLIATMTERVRHRPFVYWVQDLHPDYSVAAGLLPPGRLERAWRAAHARTLAAADRVVVLGDDMAHRVVDAGARGDRVRVIHNGAELGPDPLRSDRGHPIACEVRSGFDFVVLHAGNLGFAGAWDTLIDAAQRLEPGIGMVFLGDGAAEDQIAQAAAAAPNVAMLPRLPATDARWFNAAADLQIVTLRRGLEGLLVPSKLYGVLAAGKPVLVVADDASEAARLVRLHSCGLVADPDDPSGVAAAINWARDHPVELMEMGSRAREAAHHFERSEMFRGLADIVSEVGAERPKHLGGTTRRRE